MDPADFLGAEMQLPLYKGGQGDLFDSDLS